MNDATDTVDPLEWWWVWLRREDDVHCRTLDWALEREQKHPGALGNHGRALLARLWSD